MDPVNLGSENSWVWSHVAGCRATAVLRVETPALGVRNRGFLMVQRRVHPFPSKARGLHT